MMMPLILLVRSINYGRSGNGNTNKEKYLEANKKARRAGRPIVYQKKNIFCRVMVRNVMCLRL